MRTFFFVRDARSFIPSVAAAIPPLAPAQHASQGGEPPKRGSESEFQELARHDPQQLGSLIASGALTEGSTAFAAEALGRLGTPEAAERYLLPLLRHDNAVVREGAIHGLARHRTELILEKLREAARGDPSPAIREDAADALNED